MLQQQAGVARENPCCSVQWMNERGTQNSCEDANHFSCFASPVGFRAPKFVGGLASCAELSVPLRDVRRQSLEELPRYPVDLEIHPEMCKLVVYTDGGAALRPGEGAVASWGFVVVLLCGNEGVRVIGFASGRVELDQSHPEFFRATQLTNNTGELQAMCAVLRLAEQTQPGDTMRVEIRYDSNFAAAAIMETQQCSSNTELVHTLRHHWHCVNGRVFGGVGMTHVHVRGHSGEPWNEMAESFVEAAMSRCSVPGSRKELEKGMMSFRRAQLPGHVECREPLLVKVEPKEMNSLRIATLSVLTLSPAEERAANGMWIPARQVRLANTFEEAGVEVTGLQEC